MLGCLLIPSGSLAPVSHWGQWATDVGEPPAAHGAKHFDQTKVWKYEKRTLTLYYKVLYMDTQHPPLQTIQDIKRMMERSSRFISLSGWSGVSAGICALGGAYAGWSRLETFHTAAGGTVEYGRNVDVVTYDLLKQLKVDLIWIAAITFAAAFISAFVFTWLRSRKNGTPIWDRTVQRLAWNTILPMIAGGLFLLRGMQLDHYELVAPGCLVFYGLALVNASKYTLGEIRYLGYGQLALGIINLWQLNGGLYFWAAGFGILHIVYGIVMWYRHERASG